MIFISSSTPLTSDDHARLVVRVTVKKKIELPSDDDENPSQQALSASLGTTNTEDSRLFTVFTYMYVLCILIYIQGALDMTIMLAERPHVFLLVAEVSCEHLAFIFPPHTCTHTHTRTCT